MSKPKVILNNTTSLPILYYPRLQINKMGEIILAMKKENGLTTGILVGQKRGSKAYITIGTKLTDWEVVGELQDYDGQVTVTFKNAYGGALKG
jgi:hypothetical protein